MVKVVRKMNNDKYFDTEGVLDSFDLNVSIEAIFILRMPYAWLETDSYGNRTDELWLHNCAHHHIWQNCPNYSNSRAFRHGRSLLRFRLVLSFWHKFGSLEIGTHRFFIHFGTKQNWVSIISVQFQFWPN